MPARSVNTWNRLPGFIVAASVVLVLVGWVGGLVYATVRYL
jgi:hypothetical protein